MTAALFALIVVALAVLAIERNHARQPRPLPRMYGSNDIDDRDVARAFADLSAASAHDLVGAQGISRPSRPSNMPSISIRHGH
ncbi:hypothetical protein EV193_107203 [Herbihabitans rhizosphaerae]|uniref:Uncharacterized protein n=1 Tax=Herbihabitans rhizosphaerae TaxID=1872711 RepID=A0A4Q7KMT5_9PSEU|nr:hypothetical protein [Herbihabitans rhizosphaerae]RZS36522.1 hypothetical protein EV193_107203 [Herbihabitans rhizosphaerae]